MPHFLQLLSGQDKWLFKICWQGWSFKTLKKKNQCSQSAFDYEQWVTMRSCDTVFWSKLVDGGNRKCCDQNMHGGRYTLDTFIQEKICPKTIRTGDWAWVFRIEVDFFRTFCAANKRIIYLWWQQIMKNTILKTTIWQSIIYRAG